MVVRWFVRGPRGVVRGVVTSGGFVPPPPTTPTTTRPPPRTDPRKNKRCYMCYELTTGKLCKQCYINNSKRKRNKMKQQSTNERSEAKREELHKYTKNTTADTARGGTLGGGGSLRKIPKNKEEKA